MKLPLDTAKIVAVRQYSERPAPFQNQEIRLGNDAVRIVERFSGMQCRR
jgi:hypothetical protein